MGLMREERVCRREPGGAHGWRHRVPRMYVSVEVASRDHEQSRGAVSRIAFPSLAGSWLWYVWAAMAILVVVGYWHVRRTLRKRERVADAADAEARRRAEAKHHKARHGEIE
jgi:hypothetical protein